MAKSKTVTQGSVFATFISEGIAMTHELEARRRFGDDVIDIAVTAIISDLRTNPVTINSAAGIDGVDANDTSYNKVFPYESTPQNGRNHVHP